MVLKFKVLVCYKENVVCHSRGVAGKKEEEKVS